MLQIELYVDGVDLPEELLTTVFGFTSVGPKDGWRLLRHKDQHDFMLFDPSVIKSEVNHWPDMKCGTRGVGVKIVLCVTDVSVKRNQVMQLGFMCSNLVLAPWGSTEFTFKLKEGYLFRIKQLPQT